jgi:hypothetical protein
MSRYDWPRDGGEREDDAAGRAAYIRRRRTEFDAEGALRVSRTPQPRPAGVPFAPPNGREHLWQPLGPVTVLEGQAEGKPRVTGRVNAICVHDAGLRAYAASANGGVWYTRDGGANWVSVAGLATTNTAGILRPAQRNACGALHVEWGANEGDDLVFLGTGEITHPMRGQPGDSEGGIGVLVGDKPTKSSQPDPWVREAPNLVNNGVYRIVREPGGTIVVAATRTGLFQRPASPGAGVDWVRPSSAPFNSLGAECTDLLWTPSVGGAPARLWVWVKEGDHSGLWVRSAVGSDFERVELANPAGLQYTPVRAVLAASTPASQVWVLNDRGKGNLPALFRVTNPSGAGNKPQAHVVAGVPDILRDSGFYNIALAVHPAQPDRVALGGQFLAITTPEWVTANDTVNDAAIVIGDVAANGAAGLTFGHPTPFKTIGLGVHPDVHALAFSNGGASLWAGCDGGVFRSDNPDHMAGFYARSNGMQVIESNYLAGHPTCEGYVVTGQQDNGVIERHSTGVWKLVEYGDGGSVVFDPLAPRRFISQYVQGDWRASDGTFTLRNPNSTTQNNLLTRNGTFASAESEASAFYSTAAAIAHKRGATPPATPNVGQIIAGTTRLWYTENFGDTWTTPAGAQRWVTLPSGTDPLPGNTTQDAFGEAITVCRWQSPDVAWILGESRLMRYARTPGSDNGGGPGAWTRETVIRKNIKNKDDTTSADGPIRKSPVWTDIAVNLDPPAGAGQPPRQRGSRGALYLATIGHPDDADVDTLWWFDGTSNWFKTGLRRNGVPAPVTAIACDPAHPDEVWVGTTVGVWHGTRSRVGDAAPQWAWQSRLNGLPEAAVEDLAIFSDGTLRLLRAAIAARGTWELRLDATTVTDRTYLRAHGDDLRHRDQAVATQRDLTTPRSWHGSPDVRPRIAPALVPAPPSLVATPWRRRTFSSARREELRRFQAAMRSNTGDPRIVANGIWETYFSEVLRARGAPTLAVAPTSTTPGYTDVQIDQPFWDTHMQGAHAVAEPWGTGAPREADLYELAAPLAEGTAGSTSCTRPAAPLKIDIVVHQRGMPIDGASVRVTLLWWTDPAATHTAKWNDATTWFGGNVGWAAAVNEVLNSPDTLGGAPNPTAGQTTQPLGPGWSFALGGPNQSHRLTLAGQTLDPFHSGVATFDLDLSALAPDTVVLLVAVIRAGTTPADDIALTADTLRNLAFGHHNVAVRSLRIG